MKFLDLAKSRYTTKSYDPNKRISEEQIDELKEILRLSPSSINSQPWSFTFVADGVLKDQLAEASYFNEQRIKESSHLVVFSVFDTVGKFEDHVNKHLYEGAKAYYKEFIKPQSEAQIKSWMAHQVYLSLGFFLSAAATMGLDSTPMEGIKNEDYKKILGLEDYAPLFAVALGYRNDQDFNQPKLKPKSRLELSDVVRSV